MEVLVNTYRGSLLDLIHTGHIAVVDHTGKLLYSAGDPEKVAYARSSAKLMQAMVAVECGAIDEYGFTQQELAQICASHNGEQLHVDTVRSALAKAGLDESYLQCGIHYPLLASLADEMKEKGEKPVSVQNNCSGKHTGMLATVKHMGEDLDTYYKPEHPHQQRIINMIADICEYPAEDIVVGLDGCGVPVHAMPLKDFAKGTAKMAKPEVLGEARGAMAKRVVDAVMAYPANVSGTGKLDLKLMEKYPGKIFVKYGADGYFTGGFPGTGIGFAFKIDDGLAMPRDLVMIEMLKQIGFIPEEDLSYFEAELHPKVYNHKKELAGESKAAFTLKKHF